MVLVVYNIEHARSYDPSFCRHLGTTVLLHDDARQLSAMQTSKAIESVTFRQRELALC